jgi:periplasmic divalent cation tolerance protein
MRSPDRGAVGYGRHQQNRRPPMTERAVVMMTTVDTDEQVERLCSVLLEERLAACIQALPAVSRYRWQGEVQRDAETLLLIKTTADAADAAIRVIESHHDYDTPEIVVLPVTDGLPAYLRWLEAETRATPPEDEAS